MQDSVKSSTAMMMWAKGLRDQEEMRRKALQHIDDGKRKKQIAARLLTKLVASQALVISMTFVILHVEGEWQDKPGKQFADRLRARTTTPTLQDLEQLKHYLSSSNDSRSHLLLGEGDKSGHLGSSADIPATRRPASSIGEITGPISELTLAAGSEPLRSRRAERRVPERDEWFLMNLMAESKLQERIRLEQEKKQTSAKQEVNAKLAVAIFLLLQEVAIFSHTDELHLKSARGSEASSCLLSFISDLISRRLLELKQAQEREEEAKKKQREAFKKQQREHAEKARREYMDRIKNKVTTCLAVASV
eukprot:746681-Hanusia_phi.AAC.2